MFSIQHNAAKPWKILVEIQGMSHFTVWRPATCRHISNECSLTANLASPPIGLEHQQGTRLAFHMYSSLFRATDRLPLWKHFLFFVRHFLESRDISLKRSLERCTRPVVTREKGRPRKRSEKFWNQNMQCCLHLKWRPCHHSGEQLQTSCSGGVCSMPGKSKVAVGQS